jgi:hypothetical protein
MNKTIIGLFIIAIALLIGCQPVAPAVAPAPAGPEVAPAGAQPSAQPVASTPAEAAPAPAATETSPAPLENTPAPAREGVNLGDVCYGLMSPEEFSAICEHEGKVILTPKISEGSCWVNIADHDNNKLTGGFTVVDWKKAAKSGSEFDRGANMRRTQGAVAENLVADRDYQYTELARHNVVWQSDKFLTQLGVMDALCPPDKIIALAQKIDSHLA